MESLKLKEKLGFGLGDTASSIIWQSLMLFLANFYTDTFGISPSVTAIIYIIVLFFDAFIDVLVGLLADRTQTRWGKYRPYLLFMSLPFAFCAVLLFYTPPFSHTLKAVYALISFMLMMTVYSFINVPYSSLSSALSPDPNERTRLMSYRFTGSYTGGFIVQAFMLSLVAYLGNGHNGLGYFRTMMVLGAVCFICFLLTFKLTKERVAPRLNHNFKQDFRDLSSNKPWLLLFSISILLLFFFSMRNIVLKYYFDYYIQKKEIIIPLIGIRWQTLSAFYISGTLSILTSVIFTGVMARKWGKRRLFITSNILVILSLVSFYFMSPHHLAWIFIMQAVYSFTVGPIIPLIWSMYTDTIDYAEWKFGRRATGLVTAASLFANKVGFAFGSLFTLGMLSVSGYVPNAIQAERAIETMRQLISLYPAFGALIVFLLFRKYRLNEKKMIILQKRLKNDLK